MKRIIVFLNLSLISIIAFSQIHYSATIDFENNSQLVEIDTSQTDNLWQIGTPMKTIFDSAYSKPYAIITDTINNYQPNNLSSFQIKIIPPPGSCWGVGLMDFDHKYDFELNKDGGFIEVKYDNDSNWTNIISDTNPELGAGGYNFYSLSDTITGDIPAFTGTSNGWVHSQFHWIWQMGVKSYYHDSLTIRFSIKSDSIETNQEGWLIDNIYLELHDCTSGIESRNSKSNFPSIYPNPVTANSNIYFSNQLNQLTEISIFNSSGKKVKTIKTYLDKIPIQTKDFENGIFIYNIIQDNEFIGNGKFVVIK